MDCWDCCSEAPAAVTDGDIYCPVFIFFQWHLMEIDHFNIERRVVEIKNSSSPNCNPKKKCSLLAWDPGSWRTCCHVGNHMGNMSPEVGLWPILGPKLQFRTGRSLQTFSSQDQNSKHSESPWDSWDTVVLLSCRDPAERSSQLKLGPK